MEIFKNRPSFINSQDPEIAKKMIDDVAEIFSDRLTVKQGIFSFNGSFTY